MQLVGRNAFGKIQIIDTQMSQTIWTIFFLFFIRIYIFRANDVLFSSPISYPILSYIKSFYRLLKYSAVLFINHIKVVHVSAFIK